MLTTVDQETNLLWQAIELLLLHSLDTGVSYNKGLNQEADLNFQVHDRSKKTISLLEVKLPEAQLS